MREGLIVSFGLATPFPLLLVEAVHLPPYGKEESYPLGSWGASPRSGASLQVSSPLLSLGQRGVFSSLFFFQVAWRSAGLLRPPPHFFLLQRRRLSLVPPSDLISSLLV